MARFVDEYRLLTSVAGWVTTPQLWDTATAAPARSIEFGLGRDYTIDNSLGNPFYFNLGSGYGAPFHEEFSRQLVGIRVVPRDRDRRGNTLLVIRYGDLMGLASDIGKKSWIKWETLRRVVIPIELRPDVRELGLLRSHLLVISRDVKDSDTLLRVYDFTVYSLREQARNEGVSDPLTPYVAREFLLSAESGQLSDFQFTEDSILASAVSTFHWPELYATSHRSFVGFGRWTHVVTVLDGVDRLTHS